MSKLCRYFFTESGSFILKITKINNNTIHLTNNQNMLNSLIFTLSLLKLETLKTYIITLLTNSFIKYYKSLV